MSEEIALAAADLATVERLHARIASLVEDHAREIDDLRNAALDQIAVLKDALREAEAERDAALERVHKLNNLLAASQFGHELLRDDVRRAVALLPHAPGAALGLLSGALKEQEKANG